MAQGSGAVWAEASVGKEAPYVQESVVYTVRIYSPGNLQTVEITPPSPTGASVEELERGTVSTRVVRGRPYVVNQYHYVLTPLAPGRLEVPPARLNVQAGAEPAMGGRPAWGTQRTSLATNALRLDVAALPAAAPLPLRFLDVQVLWGAGGAGGAGEPLTVTVVSKGLGVIGGRLPSVAPQVHGHGFKVYPDPPQVDWKWGSGGAGAELWGRRVETFTIVPTRDGAIDFPAIDVPWWDVQGRREAHARVPGRRVTLDGEDLSVEDSGALDGAPGLVSRLLTREALLGFVLPVGGGIALAFGLGWWLGVGPKGRTPAPPRRTPHEAAEAAATPASVLPAKVFPGQRFRPLREFLATVPRGLPLERVNALGRATRRALLALGDRVAGVLPMRVQVWWCLRCAAGENQPDALCRVVRRLACQQLRLPPGAPLSSVVHRLDQSDAGAPSLALDEIIRDLEGAAYAGRTLDLRAWKREFRRRFRRAFAARESTGRERRRRGLPELNP